MVAIAMILVGVPAVLPAVVSVFLSRRKLAAQRDELLARHCS